MFQVLSYNQLALLYHLYECPDRALANTHSAIRTFLQQWRVAEQNLQKTSLLYPLQTVTELYDVIQNEGELVQQ